MRPRERDADDGHGEKDRRQGVRESEPLAGAHEPNDVADGAEPFDDLVGATTDHGHNTLILCIEPGIDNFPCLGNNRFFGTFLKRGGTFRQCSWRARSIDHCSPAFSDWTDQKAISLIIEFLCHFLARCSWLASFDHLVDVGAGVRAADRPKNGHFRDTSTPAPWITRPNARTEGLGQR